MSQSASAAFTARDLEKARAEGTLAGEVRVLKWGAGIAIAAILGALGLLYQSQIMLHERVARVEERLVRVEDGVARLEDRVGRLEDRVARIEERLDGIDKQLATISAQLATLISAQNLSQ